jgi:hypothetical protein
VDKDIPRTIAKNAEIAENFSAKYGLRKKQKRPKKLCEIEHFEGGRPGRGGRPPPNPGSARDRSLGSSPPGISRCAVEVERFSYSSTLVSLTSGHWLDPRMTVIGGNVLAASSDAKRCSGDTSKSQLLGQKRPA